MSTSPEALAARVEELTAQLEPGGVAEELAGALMDLYGEGLVRIFDAIAEDGSEALRSRLVEDGVVASLLLIHDLYPVPLEERVQEALDSVRPYMESHGGNVELLGIEDGVARLRLEGSCHGCAASASTLELAVEEALRATAPDLEGIDVEANHAAPGLDPLQEGSGMPSPTPRAVHGDVAGGGPEAFEHLPTRLVSGRLLTWYGPALVDAAISLDRS